MQRQQVKNVVSPAGRKPASVQPAKSRPTPLDAEALKRVVGGTASTQLPNKGW
jgi:hypothetical protein